MKVNDIFQLIKEKNIKFIDLQFGDLFGKLHHFTIPSKALTESVFEDGIPFDGSSIRQWQSIDKSDMLIKPDASSAYVDPFRQIPTLCLFNDVYDPRTGSRYAKDPRSIAWKALEYLKSTGIGDMVYFGPEPEFFVFDTIRYGSERNTAFYEIDSAEAPWTSGDEDSLGHKIDYKGGYFPTAPADTLMDFRNEAALNMEAMGLEVEVHHHEVATAGQCEIDIKYDEMIYSGDNVHKLKHAVKNTAFHYGKTATFMPKPIFEDNGNGMHIHMSIWKGGKNICIGNEYGGLSKQALYAIGGILKHGRSIQAFTNPSANSYRRLIPGYEAPVKLAYSATNRSATIRIPYSTSEKGRRFEFRCPDSSGSPYLAFAAMLMASIDGIKNQIDPGNPADKNLYNLPPEELDSLVSTCASQEEAMTELVKDKDWLMAGDVFSQDAIESYIDYRLSEEVEPLKLRPNPYEFNLYYDC